MKKIFNLSRFEKKFHRQSRSKPLKHILKIVAKTLDISRSCFLKQNYPL